MLLPSIDGQVGHLLLDNEWGRITLYPDQMPRDECDRWFACLLREIPWETERRPMYDKVVDVPRLFSRVSLDDANVHPIVAAAAQRIGEVTGAAFDSVGLNLYRNEHDSVAWHNDKLHRLQPGAPIAILSLGETRALAIRTKRAPRKSMRIDLAPGSVLLMSFETQLHLDHAILKERRACGPRISLAFRKRGAAATE